MRRTVVGDNQNRSHFQSPVKSDYQSICSAVSYPLYGMSLLNCLCSSFDTAWKLHVRLCRIIGLCDRRKLSLSKKLCHEIVFKTLSTDESPKIVVLEGGKTLI